ncbi:hypothetical protein [Brevibacillus laterosporus]|uniref:hypothetical protein n=1 Tax=Brevibacillus laterosporus TaxID=1465 RepID=UPI000EB37D4E|nr:hypothetical protein [Brevibacillus laterosporus]AYK07389.1 hypothetical protein D8Z77_13975 [Brevibacillus laterosporus]
MIKKRTLWMAVNSVYRERQLQIAQEHSRQSIYTFHTKELRKELRKEREMIIKQFDSEKKHNVLLAHMLKAEDISEEAS